MYTFFGQRDSNIDDLKRRGDDFLSRILVDALKQMSIPDASMYGLQCRASDRKENIGRVFYLSPLPKMSKSLSVPFKAKIWVGLNVYRFLAIYYVELPKNYSDQHINEVKKLFEFTITGAEKVGYSAVFQPAKIGGECLCSVWLVANADKDLLTDPKSKLFWAQDIAMMTESFFRAAYRNNISLCPEADPGPL